MYYHTQGTSTWLCMSVCRYCAPNYSRHFTYNIYTTIITLPALPAPARPPGRRVIPPPQLARSLFFLFFPAVGVPTIQYAYI